MACVSGRFNLANSNSNETPSSVLARRLAAVATDLHFWVPTLVLIAGLMLLRWVR